MGSASDRPGKTCAVLFVKSGKRDLPHVSAMRAIGFVVDEAGEWPADTVIRDYHVLIVHVRDANAAPMLAARLRAKPHFGRRLLVALVPADTHAAVRRAAEASGFDAVVNDCCDPRHLSTRVLRGLRLRSELRCALPAGRRSAA